MRRSSLPRPRRRRLRGGAAGGLDLLARTGTDYAWARTFPAPLVRCRLEGVGVDVSLDVIRGKSPLAEFWSLGLEALGPRMIEADLLSADALDDALALLADPDFWDLSPAAYPHGTSRRVAKSRAARFGIETPSTARCASSSEHHSASMCRVATPALTNVEVSGLNKSSGVGVERPAGLLDRKMAISRRGVAERCQTSRWRRVRLDACLRTKATKYVVKLARSPGSEEFAELRMRSVPGAVQVSAGNGSPRV